MCFWIFFLNYGWTKIFISNLFSLYQCKSFEVKAIILEFKIPNMQFIRKNVRTRKPLMIRKTKPLSFHQKVVNSFYYVQFSRSLTFPRIWKFSFFYDESLYSPYSLPISVIISSHAVNNSYHWPTVTKKKQKQWFSSTDAWLWSEHPRCWRLNDEDKN